MGEIAKARLVLNSAVSRHCRSVECALFAHITYITGPYDTIIVDPPSFQKKSFIAKTDYCKILRRLPDLLTEDGKVLLCLNAPSLDTTWLHDQVNKEAPDLEFVERVPNPEVFQAMDPERALKVILYQKR